MSAADLDSPSAPVSVADLDSAYWISVPTAMKRGVWGRRAITKMIDSGKLSVRWMPGSQPRVLASEIDALIRASTRLKTE